MGKAVVHSSLYYLNRQKFSRMSHIHRRLGQEYVNAIVVQFIHHNRLQNPVLPFAESELPRLRCLPFLLPFLECLHQQNSIWTLGLCRQSGSWYINYRRPWRLPANGGEFMYGRGAVRGQQESELDLFLESKGTRRGRRRIFPYDPGVWGQLRGSTAR